MQIDQRERAAMPAMGKIIPLRRDGWLVAETFRAPVADRERGRHFLKVTLPAIPVAIFTLTFLLGYFLGAGNMNAPRVIDPVPALGMALVLTGVVSLLCVAIYSGYRHVTGLNNGPVQ